MSDTVKVGDIITREHRGETVTGEVLSVMKDGSRVSVTLHLRSPEFVLGPTGRKYYRIYLSL